MVSGGNWKIRFPEGTGRKEGIDMPLVTSTEMFKKAYNGGYAVGAFNINNMEIVQAITEAASELHSPVILEKLGGSGSRAVGYSERPAAGPWRRF